MRKPSPAVAISLVALLFALGGTAIAAQQYIITSTKQIKPNVLRYLKGQKGAQGLHGLPGTTGPAGITGIQYVNGAASPYCTASGGACAVATSTVTCPSGTTIVSGGYYISSITAHSLADRASGNGWTASAYNEGTIAGTVQAYAICISGPGVPRVS